MTRDALFIQAEEIRIEMASISPKIELWKKLEKQLHEIYQRTGGKQKGLGPITVAASGGTIREREAFNRMQKNRLYKRRRQIQYKDKATIAAANAGIKQIYIGETSELSARQILGEAIRTHEDRK